MTIRRRNTDPGSLLYGPVGPFTVTLPRTDFAGIASFSPTAAGDKVPMTGSYCRNISTDTFSCDLRVPTQIVITTVAIADQWQLLIKGKDHLGRSVQEVCVKAATNRQTEGISRYCYSHIDSITVLAGTTITNNFRLGWCCAVWTLENTGLTRRLTTGIGSNRRIPLPFIPRYTTDVGVIYAGAKPDINTFITSNPTANQVGGVNEASRVTFSGTNNVTATYSANTLTWTVSAIQAGDIAVTWDGFTGVVASTAANAITVSGWYKNGQALPSPTVPQTFVYSLSTSERDGFPAVSVYRPTVTANYSLTTGGMLPGQPLIALAGTAGSYSGVTQSVSAGVDLTAANFGTLLDVIHEPWVDVTFDVYLANGAAY